MNEATLRFPYIIAEQGCPEPLVMEILREDWQGALK